MPDLQSLLPRTSLGFYPEHPTAVGQPLCKQSRGPSAARRSCRSRPGPDSQVEGRIKRGRAAAQARREWGVCTDGRGLAHGEGSVTRPTKLRRDPSEARMLIVCSKNFLQGPTLEFSDQPLPSGNWRGRRVRTTSLLGEQTVRWARRSWEGAWRHTCCARCSGPGAKGAPSITVQRLPLQAPPTSYPAPSSEFRDCLGRI